jgi:hypothetical protein
MTLVRARSKCQCAGKSTAWQFKLFGPRQHRIGGRIKNADVLTLDHLRLGCDLTEIESEG